MNYTEVLETLKSATLFDLYRLHVAIGNELNNPTRIAQVKQSLRLGEPVQYFDAEKNRAMTATVLKLKPKSAVIYNQENNRRYQIPYSMLNTNQMDTDIHRSKQTPLTMNHLQVGDLVGFNKDGMEIIGMIKRLNQKTVTLHTKEGYRWRVAYNYLFRVTNTTIGQGEIVFNVQNDLIELQK